MAGTRAAGKNFNSAVNFFIDITPIVSTAQQIAANGQVFADKETHTEFAGAIIRKLSAEMTQAAVQNSSRMAHVYSWDRIITDSVDSYSVDHNKSKPLWYLRPSKRHKGYVIKINFLKGPDELPVAENIKARNIKDLSRYHFRDQAQQLESVKIIDKGMNVSRTKRRTYTSKWLKDSIRKNKKKRIAMVSSNKVVVLKNFRRKNDFHQEFSKFFLTFWDFSAVDEASRDAADMIMKASTKTLSTVSKEAMKAGSMNIMRAGTTISARSGLSSSVKATVNYAPNVVVIHKGKQVNTMGGVRFDPSRSNVKQAYDAIVKKGLRNVKAPRPAPGHRVV